MNKILSLSKIKLLVAFFFALTSAKAQTSNHGSAGSKTVSFKIKKKCESPFLTPKEVIDIDKLLVSKKGILACNTNGKTWMVSVKMENNFPEAEVKNLLGDVLKLEIESYELIDNSK